MSLAGEPHRNMSVHLADPLEITSSPMNSSERYIETVTFGRMLAFTLYFDGGNQRQLDNLHRLETAVAEAINRVQARMLEAPHAD